MEWERRVLQHDHPKKKKKDPSLSQSTGVSPKEQPMLLPVAFHGEKKKKKQTDEKKNTQKETLRFINVINQVIG